jgi:hypothetical protein
MCSVSQTTAEMIGEKLVGNYKEGTVAYTDV